jgi:hypothetical protein
MESVGPGDAVAVGSGISVGMGVGTGVSVLVGVRAVVGDPSGASGAGETNPGVGDGVENGAEAEITLVIKPQDIKKKADISQKARMILFRITVL